MIRRPTHTAMHMHLHRCVRECPYIIPPLNKNKTLTETTRNYKSTIIICY